MHVFRLTIERPNASREQSPQCSWLMHVWPRSAILSNCGKIGWKPRTFCPSQTSINYTMNRITFTTCGIFCEFLINYRLGYSHNKSQKFVNSLTSNVKGRSSSSEVFFLIAFSVLRRIIREGIRTETQGFSWQSPTSKKHSVCSWKMLWHNKIPRHCISSGLK